MMSYGKNQYYVYGKEDYNCTCIKRYFKRNNKGNIWDITIYVNVYIKKTKNYEKTISTMSNLQTTVGQN